MGVVIDKLVIGYWYLNMFLTDFAKQNPKYPELSCRLICTFVEDCNNLENE